MADVFGTEDSVFFVSGTAGAATQGGCTKEWFDANFTQLTDIMNGSGGPIDNAASATYTHATKRVTKAGAFTNTEVGMVAYIAGTNITTGRYKVTAVDPSGDWFDASGIVSTGDNADTGVNVGGSFANLQSALDNTNAGTYGVHIYTNKNETVSSDIDIDTGSGSLTNHTQKIIEGFDTVPGDMNRGGDSFGEYVEYDGSGTFSGRFFDYSTSMENIEARNLCVQNASSAKGFNIGDYNNAKNLIWRNCKASGIGDGWWTGQFPGSAHVCIDCEATGCVDGFSGSTSTMRVNLYYNCISHDNSQEGFQAAAAVLINCVAYGNRTNYIQGGSGVSLLINCTGYDGSSDGVAVGTALATLIAINCIMHTNADKNYDQQAGMLITEYCDSYNGTNPDNQTSFMGDITDDPQFADAGSADFRPRNPAVLRGGKPDTAGNETEMGAVQQKYQYPDRGRNRAANFGRLAIIR